MNSSISSSRYGGWAIGTLTLGVLLFICFFAASEFLVRYRVEPKDHFWKHVKVFLTSSSPNVVLGDSIAARGFIGGDGFINLAMPGEAPNVTRLKVEAYFAKRKPGYVVIALNANILKRDKRNLSGYEDAFTKSESRLSALRARHRERMFGYWTVWLTKGSLDDHVDVLEDGGLVEKARAANFAFSRLSAAERLEEAIRNVTRDSPPAHVNNSPNLQLIRDIVNFVRERGGAPCLVEFPSSADYRAVAVKRKDFVEARRHFKEFASGLGVKFVDFWDRFSDDRLFLNGNHLNEDGGRRLAPLIISECLG